MRKTGIASVMLLIMTFAALMLASVSVAYAKRETINVAFHSEWAEPPEKETYRYSGSMEFIYRSRSGDFTGDIVGSWTSQTTLINQWDDVAGRYVTKRIIGVYEATATIIIDGEAKSGTFTMKIESVPPEGLEARKWSIVKGTGDLQGIRGNGAYTRTPPTADYTGELSLNLK